MDMILVSVDLFDDNVGMMLRPRFEKFFEIALNPNVKDLASVFTRPHQMEVTRKHTVAHSAIHGHVYSLRYPVNTRTLSDAGKHFIPRASARGTAG